MPSTPGTIAVQGVHFDYQEAEIPKAVETKLVKCALEINEQKRKTMQAVIAIGARIKTAQELLAKSGRDSKFGSWIFLECGISRSSAYNLLDAFDRFHDFKKIDQFDQTALYKLSQKKVPKAASNEAKRLADKGVHITSSVANEILKKHNVEGSEEEEGEKHTATVVYPADVDITGQVDDADVEVPEKYEEVFKTRGTFVKAVGLLEEVHRMLKQLKDEPGGRYIGVRTVTSVEALIERVDGARPCLLSDEYGWLPAKDCE